VYQPDKHLQPTCFGPGIQNQVLLARTKNSTNQPFLPSKHPLASPSPHWTSPPKCVERGNGTKVYCVFTSATFAHGRGISILTTPANAATLARLPAFADPGVHDATVALSRAPPAYELRELPGRGIGAVAARTLHRGDVIFSESPSFLLHDAVASDVDDALRHSLQRHAVDGLPAPLRDETMGLLGHFGDMDPIDDRLATNAFSIELFDDGRPPEGDKTYGVKPASFNALLPLISVRNPISNVQSLTSQRANHACRPNSNYHFDTQTLTQHVHATTTIPAGDEITVTYIDPVQTHAERHAYLARNWGFACTCAHCQLTAYLRNASDARVEAILALEAAFDADVDGRRADPAMAEHLVALYAQERLWAPAAGAHMKAALEHAGVGNEHDALRHARLGVELGYLYSGPWDDDVEEMKRLLAAVKEHPSWNIFNRKLEEDDLPSAGDGDDGYGDDGDDS
jgi:hypothetical protein